MGFPRDADLDVTVRVYLGANPNDAPGTWPAPVEFTAADRVLRRPIQIRRGRGKNQKTAQAGSCTFWLDNTDGALTPLLPTSQYYPDWDLGVPCDLSVSGVGNAPPYVRHAGNVADIQAVMVPGTNGLNISAVQVTSAGPLRRISQGAVVKSALSRTALGSNPVAYWSLEDGSDSTQGGSAVDGVPPLLNVDGLAVWAGDTTVPPGSSPLPDLSALAELSAAAMGSFASTSHAVQFLFRTAGTSTPIRWTIGGGDYNRARVDVTAINTQVQLIGDGIFTTILSASTAIANSAYHLVRVVLAQSGADITAELWIDGLLVDTGTAAASVLGPPVGVRLNPQGEAGGAGNTILSVGHVAFFNGAGPDTFAAFDAYSGEQAHDRIERICAEEGIPYSGTATTSVECGPQQLADVVTVLQDAEEVDHGILVEDFAFGLNYLASSQRENLDPIITIDLSTYRTTSGTQGDVLTPVRNDARIRNEWTISRPDGSSATVNDTTHIAKRGLYNDSATVGVADDTRLLDEAGWRVHEGTFDGLRYDTVPLDVAANL